VCAFRKVPQLAEGVHVPYAESKSGPKVLVSMATKKQIPIRLVETREDIHEWVILSLDPSLTRTGFSIMTVTREGVTSRAKWVDVGSIAPKESADPIWVRAKCIAMAALERLERYESKHSLQHVGLIVTFEHPTPREDRLVTLNRVLHLVLFGSGIASNFGAVQVLSVNANTLRSLMGLTARGAKNKEENKVKAYTYLDEATYPNLDTDSCDAVLLAMVARYVASLLFGHHEDIPSTFLSRLCNGSLITKGKGRNARILTEGVLHRADYWYPYAPGTYSVSIRNAKSPKRTLELSSFVV
jgi:hypothetical protein